MLESPAIQARPAASLTLVPPSPVTERIAVDVRGAVWNESDQPLMLEAALYLDDVDPSRELHRERLAIPPGTAAGIRHAWPAEAGTHTLILSVRGGVRRDEVRRPIVVLPSAIRSTERIGGAYAGLYHWSEAEGRRWNADLKTFTDDQWRELVRGMHAIGMDIILIQELFRNQAYSGKHTLERDGYQGRAFYPSKLFPGRMPIAAEDPVEAILSEADALGMHVCLGLGLYAWFDYSPGSLEWHLKVADEVWERYGHHPSFYAWKVSEEGHGSLTDLSGQPGSREQLLRFFEVFTPHVKRLAPDKPVMMARSTHGMRGAEETYRKLLPHLDILLAFCFHRMPPDDMTGEEAAAMLQELCDEAGSHLWMNAEVFLFEGGVEAEVALIPRPIGQIVQDLRRFPNFEKIVCYQFPGLMNSPGMSITPGGPGTVALYRDYLDYVNRLERKVADR